MNILIVGQGGSGKGIWLPVLQNLKIPVTFCTLDINPATYPMFTSYSAVMDEMWDLVIVAVPTPKLQIVARLFFGRAKIILVEKPGFARCGDWVDGVETAKAMGTELYMVRNNYFRAYELFRPLRGIVKNVSLYWEVKVDRFPGKEWRLSDKPGGGAILDLMPHLLHVLQGIGLAPTWTNVSHDKGEMSAWANGKDGNIGISCCVLWNPRPDTGDGDVHIWDFDLVDSTRIHYDAGLCPLYWYDKLLTRLIALDKKDTWSTWKDLDIDMLLQLEAVSR